MRGRLCDCSSNVCADTVAVRIAVRLPDCGTCAFADGNADSIADREPLSVADTSAGCSIGHSRAKPIADPVSDVLF